MPKLISLYIRQVVLGFAIAAAFVGGLLWFDVVNLWSLIKSDSAGYMAVFMLWFANGIVFAGVQFAIRIMLMAEDDDTSSGGKRLRIRREPVLDRVTVPVPVEPRRYTKTIPNAKAPM